VFQRSLPVPAVLQSGKLGLEPTPSSLKKQVRKELPQTTNEMSSMFYDPDSTLDRNEGLEAASHASIKLAVQAEANRKVLRKA